MKHTQGYEPFGQEWKDHLMKEPKKFIIDLFKNSCQEREKLQKQKGKLLEALKGLHSDLNENFGYTVERQNQILEAIKQAESI